MEIIKEDKLSIFRKYFTEVILLGLSSCVLYLFMSYRDLNLYIRDNLTQQVIDSKIIIQENTSILKETNFIIKNKKTNENSN